VTPLRFSPRALSFLRGLKRNNNREWFKARKEQYDELLRAPMLAIIDALARDFRTFAPDVVASPKVSMYRIYRDTRFSEDKSPLKTHVAAMFPWRGLAKHEGAGMYFHVALDGVWVGGGMYSPDTSQLQTEREHIAANIKRFRTIVESPRFKRVLGALDGEQLQRVPRGFPKDHEAAAYLRYRQFLGGKEFPAQFACSPGFYKGILAVFREVAPLVKFLNEPLVK
jgi:uncharacterized protein (TIGR02453 family)